MTRTEQRIESLKTEKATEHLAFLYGNEPETVRAQRERYTALIRTHAEAFGERAGLTLFSAPGRTEIGGNHTDHNRGRVLAAGINLDALCAASPREDFTVRFRSEGYAPIEMDLSDTGVRAEEEGTTAALSRGVAGGVRRVG